jgi:hypothetical protein
MASFVLWALVVRLAAAPDVLKNIGKLRRLFGLVLKSLIMCEPAGADVALFKSRDKSLLCPYSKWETEKALMTMIAGGGGVFVYMNCSLTYPRPSSSSHVAHRGSVPKASNRIAAAISMTFNYRLLCCCSLTLHGT